MSKVKYITDVLALACLVLALAGAARDNDLLPWPPTPNPTPEPEPEPEPEPPAPIESPFPSDGFWLLVASQGEDTSKLVVNAKDVRDFPGLESHWHDYDQRGLAEPWQKAIDYAKSKGGSGVYYVARHGGKASEGQLSGSLQQMHDTIAGVLEELK